jgi:hypothetical protein
MRPDRAKVAPSKHDRLDVHPMTQDEEKVIKSIEDLRTEVRELREMVNMLVEMMIHMETMEDVGPDVEGNMMNYDSMLKSGRYCM